MAIVIQYDPTSSPVANQVTFYNASANTPDYQGQPNTLINPVFTVDVEAVPQKYWKVDTDVVVEMSQGEKDSIVAAEAAASEAAVISAAEAFINDLNSGDPTAKVIVALAKALLDGINILRVNQHGLAEIPFSTLKSQVESYINS